jgi:hypothetical protein
VLGCIEPDTLEEKREGKGKEGKQQAFWASWRNMKKKPTTNVHDFKADR